MWSLLERHIGGRVQSHPSGLLLNDPQCWPQWHHVSCVYVHVVPSVSVARGHWIVGTTGLTHSFSDWFSSPSIVQDFQKLRLLDGYYRICCLLFLRKVAFVWCQSSQLRSGTLFQRLSCAASGLGDLVRASTYVLPYLGKKRGIFSHLLAFFSTTDSRPLNNT